MKIIPFFAGIIQNGNSLLIVLSIFAGKKGHHKKGHYDDEHKGHKGNNCMKLLCKKFPRNKLLVFFIFQARKVMTSTTNTMITTTRRAERKAATKRDMRKRVINSHSPLKIEIPMLDSYQLKFIPLSLFDAYLFDFLHILIISRCKPF